MAEIVTGWKSEIWGWVKMVEIPEGTAGSCKLASNKSSVAPARLSSWWRWWCWPLPPCTCTWGGPPRCPSGWSPCRSPSWGRSLATCPAAFSAPGCWERQPGQYLKERKTKPRRAGDLVEGLATDGAGGVHPQVGGDTRLGWCEHVWVKNWPDEKWKCGNGPFNGAK